MMGVARQQELHEWLCRLKRYEMLKQRPVAWRTVDDQAFIDGFEAEERSRMDTLITDKYRRAGGAQ